MQNPTAASTSSARASRGRRLWNDIKQAKTYYLLMLPALIYVLIFCYQPMYGLQIAFKDYKGVFGISGSPWVGLTHFISFFKGYYFWRLMKNTLIISLYSMVVSFPLPIILALLLNEVTSKLRKASQTILYAPHFISTVVLVGMINVMFSPSIGVVNHLIEALGGERVYFLAQPSTFRHIYVWSGAWQETGWGAVIYIAALAGVSPELHEAATIDGASRLQRMIHINLPSILPTIMILLIMRIGSLVNVGYEKVYLLQNSLNQEVSEVISTYVYKRGILNTSYSFSSAVGLFNNIINVALLLLANAFSRKATETSLF